MQIVALGDNLHEMSKPIFWGKCHQNVVYWICPESGKGYMKIFVHLQKNKDFIFYIIHDPYIHIYFLVIPETFVKSLYTVYCTINYSLSGEIQQYNLSDPRGRLINQSLEEVYEQFWSRLCLGQWKWHLASPLIRGCYCETLSKYFKRLKRNVRFTNLLQRKKLISALPRSVKMASGNSFG